MILLAAQRRAKTDEPEADDMYEIGTVGHIIQLLRFPKGPVKVLIEGRGRARINQFAQQQPFFLCDVTAFTGPAGAGSVGSAGRGSVAAAVAAGARRAAGGAVGGAGAGDCGSGVILQPASGRSNSRQIRRIEARINRLQSAGETAPWRPPAAAGAPGNGG